MLLFAAELNHTQAGLRLVDLDCNGETVGENDKELSKIGKAGNVDFAAVSTHFGVAGDWTAVSSSPGS